MVINIDMSFGLILHNESAQGEEILMDLGFITLYRPLKISITEFVETSILLWPSPDSADILRSEPNFELNCKWADHESSFTAPGRLATINDQIVMHCERIINQLDFRTEHLMISYRL